MGMTQAKFSCCEPHVKEDGEVSIVQIDPFRSRNSRLTSASVWSYDAEVPSAPSKGCSPFNQ